jgi:hypothetical protein
MLEHDGHNLEQALSRTEADAAATLKATDALTKALRRFRTASRVGNLRELHSSIEAAERAMDGLRQQFANAKEGWNFDEERYFASGLYAKEVIATGQQMGVRISEHDERLYCYPALIQISARDKAVLIDKKRESRIRPSVLVARLRELQLKPSRFKPESFLEILFKPYTKAVAMRRKDMLQMAPVVPLLDIYELLTMLPGQTGEYPRQEFVRDIYLLHRSGVDTTKTGAKVSFPIARGVQGRTLTVIDEKGEEKRYYGISFTQTSKER